MGRAKGSGQLSTIAGHRHALATDAYAGFTSVFGDRRGPGCSPDSPAEPADPYAGWLTVNDDGTPCCCKALIDEDTMAVCGEMYLYRGVGYHHSPEGALDSDGELLYDPQALIFCVGCGADLQESVV